MRDFKRVVFGRALNLAEEDNSLYLYDVIGSDAWGGIDPTDVIAALKTFDGADIDLRINSPGGYVTEGIAMYNALKEYDGKITGYIDGLAASAASFVAMAADTLHVNEGAFVMVHEAHTAMAGNASALRKEADLLEKMNGEIANIYAGRASATQDEWLAIMAGETWFTASEAVEHGIADSADAPAVMKNVAFDVSSYKNAPEVLQERYSQAIEVPIVVEEQEAEVVEEVTPTVSVEMRKRRLTLATIR